MVMQESSLIVSKEREKQRKAMHLLPAIIAPALYLLLTPFLPLIYIIVIILSLLLILSTLFIVHEIGLKKGFAHKVPFASHVFSVMKREHEVNHKTFIGAPIYFTTSLIMFLVVHPAVGIIAFSVSALADASAALFGVKYGRFHVPFSPRKTIEGSTAFLVTAFSFTLLILFSFSWVPQTIPLSLTLTRLIIVSLFCALLGMLSELTPGPWYVDELTVPLALGISLQYFLNQQWFFPVLLFFS